MARRGEGTRIPHELRTFLESGLSIVIATRDRDLQPDCAAAWAVRLHADGSHLTVFLSDAAAEEMLRNLEQCPEIAIDLDRPTSHRACQIKGHYLSSRSARAAERQIVETQAEAFAADVEGIGIPRVMLAGWSLWPCTALKVRVHEVFEQTPGPGTGELLW